MDLTAVVKTKVALISSVSSILRGVCHVIKNVLRAKNRSYNFSAITGT